MSSPGTVGGRSGRRRLRRALPVACLLHLRATSRAGIAETDWKAQVPESVVTIGGTAAQVATGTIQRLTGQVSSAATIRLGQDGALTGSAPIAYTATSVGQHFGEPGCGGQEELTYVVDSIAGTFAVRGRRAVIFRSPSGRQRLVSGLAVTTVRPV